MAPTSSLSLSQHIQHSVVLSSPLPECIKSKDQYHFPFLNVFFILCLCYVSILPSEDDDEADDSESLRWFFPRKFLASNAPPAPALELLVLSRRDWGNLSNIFFGFKHQSCSGLIQFQRTQGNHKAIPISMVRKTISWVLRLIRLTLKQR